LALPVKTLARPSGLPTGFASSGPTYLAVSRPAGCDPRIAMLVGRSSFAIAS
jgi:hypothetical protein